MFRLTEAGVTTIVVSVWLTVTLTLLVVALVFGIINALVRPVLLLLTCPLVVLTLGLFLFVLNGFLLWLTAAFSGALGIHFHVAGFWPAIWGGLVVGIVSMLLNIFVRD